LFSNTHSDTRFYCVILDIARKCRAKTNRIYLLVVRSVCAGSVFCIAITDGRNNVDTAKIKSSTYGSCSTKGDVNIANCFYRILCIFPIRPSVILGSEQCAVHCTTVGHHQKHRACRVVTELNPRR